MPKLEGEIELRIALATALEALARQWGCDAETALVRAAEEMLEREPEPAFEQQDNVIFLESENS